MDESKPTDISLLGKLLETVLLELKRLIGLLQEYKRLLSIGVVVAAIGLIADLFTLSRVSQSQEDLRFFTTLSVSESIATTAQETHTGSFFFSAENTGNLVGEGGVVHIFAGNSDHYVTLVDEIEVDFFDQIDLMATTVREAGTELPDYAQIIVCVEPVANTEFAVYPIVGRLSASSTASRNQYRANYDILPYVPGSKATETARQECNSLLGSMPPEAAYKLAFVDSADEIYNSLVETAKLSIQPPEQTAPAIPVWNISCQNEGSRLAYAYGDCEIAYRESLGANHVLRALHVSSSDTDTDVVASYDFSAGAGEGGILPSANRNRVLVPAAHRGMYVRTVWNDDQHSDWQRIEDELVPRALNSRVGGAAASVLDVAALSSLDPQAPILLSSVISGKLEWSLVATVSDDRLPWYWSADSNPLIRANTRIVTFNAETLGVESTAEIPQTGRDVTLRVRFGDSPLSAEYAYVFNPVQQYRNVLKTGLESQDFISCRHADSMRSALFPVLCTLPDLLPVQVAVEKIYWGETASELHDLDEFDPAAVASVEIERLRTEPLPTTVAPDSGQFSQQFATMMDEKHRQSAVASAERSIGLTFLREGWRATGYNRNILASRTEGNSLFFKLRYWDGTESDIMRVLIQ